MRGKQTVKVKVGADGGLIPAHAGKTPVYRRFFIRSRAHPRACGENDWTDLDTNGAAGSSPRMRGKPGLVTFNKGIGGLIPAHAGKTYGKVFNTVPQRAHPRACGENSTANSELGGWNGSSPRMRGKPLT